MGEAVSLLVAESPKIVTSLLVGATMWSVFRKFSTNKEYFLEGLALLIFGLSIVLLSITVIDVILSIE